MRIFIADDDDRATAEGLLDCELIDFDYDNGDRMIIAEEDFDDVCDILEDNGIDFDEI